MSEIELLPCPVCGSPAVAGASTNPGGPTTVWVGCPVCQTRTFDAATIDRMIGHYRTLLEAAVADPGRRLAALPLLSLVSTASTTAMAHMMPNMGTTAASSPVTATMAPTHPHRHAPTPTTTSPSTTRCTQASALLALLPPLVALDLRVHRLG